MIIEKNFISKKIKDMDLRFALVYPNIYRTAMSSLGYQLLYKFINIREDTYCERAVFPNSRTLETNSPLKDFDIISFTFQYEEDYINFLKMLKQENIPLKSDDRSEKDPLIIAGGPCVTSNPEPIADFIDLFVIGDGEPVLNSLIDCYKENKKDLEKYLNIQGIYIPKFKNRTCIALAENMDETYHITEPVITQTDEKELIPVFNNSIMLNVSRGCARGCRFCMSTYLYRPVRETSVEKLFETAETARKKTGLNKITLIGAAVSDYSKLNELSKGLLERGFEMSTPSLRIESITREYLETLKESGLKTITLAPESISKLRKKINKDIPDEKIFEIVKGTIDMGFKIKFYFLIGLPDESMEDIKELANYIKELGKIKPQSVRFSINPLIPKANTPLQWASYDLKDIKSKMRYLKKELKRFDIKYESPKKGMIQYILSCGDNSLSDILLKSLNSDITLKEWKEYMPDYESCVEFPWSNIDVGISDTFLKLEKKRIEIEKTTPWCEKDNCSNCGSCK